MKHIPCLKMVLLCPSSSCRGRGGEGAGRGGGTAELYSGGGVSVGNVCAVLASAEGVERVERLHTRERVWDHGDGVGGHERDVVGRPAQRERVVRRAGEPQRVVGLQRLTLVVQLLHLQGHDLLVLDVRDVVGGVPLRAGAPVGLVASLVLLVIEGSEGQDVQEQQGRPHGDGDAQLGGVIPFGLDEDRGVLGARLVRVLGVLGVAVGWGDGRAFGRGPDLGGRPPGPVGEGRHVRRGHLGGGGHILEYLVQVVQVWDQFQPEGDFRGPIVIPHAGLQADVQIQLVFGVILGPGHLLEAVGFCVNELGVLRDRLIGVTEDRREREKREGGKKKRSHSSACHKSILIKQNEMTVRSSHVFIDTGKVPKWLNPRVYHSALSIKESPLTLTFKILPNENTIPFL